MLKSTITRVFVGSLIAIAGGVALMCAAVVFGAANGAFVVNGPDIVGVRSGYGWGVAVLVATAVLAMIGGSIGQFVAWIGAILNTAQLEDKTWFLVLLLLGILSFGFVAMVLYVLAGPDGTLLAAERRSTGTGRAASVRIDRLEYRRWIGTR